MDKILDYEPGKMAKGIKCVSANEMQFMGHFPGISAVMLGRGLLSDPYLLGRLRGEKLPEEQVRRDTIGEFHEQLMEEYGAVLSCDRDLLYKMKELWFYLLDSFSDSEKARKQIRKCEKLREYRSITEHLFKEHKVR